ncbi:short transient receptor potential channel 7-like, partial [Physella acuta]|uniref:short transient receptor potential channel 7-like n=1 Tax=Physella acuta TaxID=109671 RepID=UPI0027DAE5D6
ALLAAADNDMERVCEMILDHPLYRESVRRETERQAAELSGEEGVVFPEDPDSKFSHANLSKLLLEVLLRAAKRNNFQIVKKIMMCGVFLEEPHDYFCACPECTEGRREDFKVYTTRRLDTFTALASPAYISLTAEDPILAAFYLSSKFRRLSEIEGEYKQIYLELDQQVQNFTLALLDQCQSSDEVKAVLSGKSKKRQYYDDSGGKASQEDDGMDGGNILPLVYTAVRMEQKKFVAHPQCQAQIGEMWFSGVPFLRYLNRFTYLMLAIPIGIVCCPVLSMMYLVSPWAKVSRIVNTPLMKFLSYTCSYLTFLILIIVAKLYLRNYIDSFTCEKPETFAYVILFFVYMWIAGLIYEECKQIFASGARDYFASFWNIIDSTMLSFLLASFVLELVTPIRLHELRDSDYVDGYNITNLLASKKQSVTSSPICQQAREAAAIPHSKFCTTARDPDGFQVVWDSAWVPDPELLSDVLFSLGMIFSVSRFSFIMPANEALGTMLVSFRRTVVDIVKLFGMFVLVILAFTCGITALYAPSRCHTESFDSFTSTLSTLTWSMFGLGDKEHPKVEEQGQLHATSLTNNPDRSGGASTVGYYLYGIYVFCTTVVLLNLLIAVMSNTFQEVQDERDVEWKFARTELWLAFIEPGTPVPPPFNILPSPRLLWKSIMWMCRRSKFRHLLPHEGKKVRYVAVQTGSMLELQDMEEEKSESSIEGKHTRNDVMCLLIRRYVRHVERMKIEGEDGEKTSSEETMRRLIERLGAKVDKRLDDLQMKLMRLDKEVDGVKTEGVKSHVLQKDHLEKFVEFSSRKTTEGDKYAHMLDEAKLQILARMDSERIQMERVFEHKVITLTRKLDETSRLLSQQMDRMQGIKGTGSAPQSPSRSK